MSIGRTLFIYLLMAAGAQGAISNLRVWTTVVSPQPVGTEIQVQASASGTGSVWYRFTLSENGGPATMVRDFGPLVNLRWFPHTREGTFTIEVTARDNADASTQSQSVPFVVTARALGGNAAVTAVPINPMVALFSAPACAAGSQFRVRFQRIGDAGYSASPFVACNGTTTQNQYVAGMRANSTYLLTGDVLTGGRLSSTATLSFATGSPTVSLPPVTVSQAPTNPGALAQGVIVFTFAAPPMATDLAGNLIWYSPESSTYGYLRPVGGGGDYLTADETTDRSTTVLARYDLAGYLVMQTNAARMTEQLQAGMPGVQLNSFHHDAQLLPDGRYLVLGAREQVVAAQGGDVVGDMFLVLDSNFQLVWAWDSFAHLDTSRKAVLGEACPQGLALGCPAIYNAGPGGVAQDWTHGNSVALTPDHNIIYSARHQDFVYKIDYRDGAGDGHVIWRLGSGGDFTALSADPYPWQSHQHDVEYEAGNVVSLYDNGNTRIQSLGGGNSRGQVLSIDESNRIVSYVMNVDLGVYSAAVGSAQKLADGNYHFNNGFATPASSVEVTTSGVTVFRIQVNGAYPYRSFRMKSMWGI